MESLQNLLCLTAYALAVPGTLIYSHVNCGSCAPAARNLSALATVLQRLLNELWHRVWPWLRVVRRLAHSPWGALILLMRCER